MKKYILHAGSLLLIGVLLYPLVTSIIITNKACDILLHDTYGVDPRLDVYRVAVIMTGAVSYLLHLLVVNMLASLRITRMIQVLISLILLILIYVDLAGMTNDYYDVVSILASILIYASLFILVQLCWWVIVVVTIIRKKHKV